MDGFRATAVCPVGGPRAVEKARRTAESIIKRLGVYSEWFYKWTSWYVICCFKSNTFLPLESAIQVGIRLIKTTEIKYSK